MMNKKLVILSIFLVLFTITSCKKKMHTVTFYFDENTIYTTEQVKNKESLKSNATPQREGYQFMGWYLGDELYDFNSPVTRDITLVARWEKSQYTVQFILNNEKTSEQKLVHKENVLHDSVVTCFEPTTLDDEVFSGWYYNDKLFDFSTPITENTILYGEIKIKKLKVNYITNTNQKISESVVRYNELVTRPTLQQPDGYQFMGWYLGDEPYDFNTPVTSNITLVAKWEKVKYRVLFVTNCELTVERKYVFYNDYIDEPEPLQRDGYTFLGWFENGELFDFTSPITFPHRLEAMWDINKEKLTEVLDNMIDIAIDEEGYLPNAVEGLNGTICWSASNNNIVNEEGKITRLANESLILTATIIKEKESYQLVFNKEIEKRYLKPLVNGKIVSGYFAGYSGFHPLNEKVLEQLDIINFAFGQIQDGKAYLPNESVALETLKYREKGIHVVLAIGGWGAGGFSEAMLTSESRTKLVDSIMEILKKYQFDGIDIDWEYPTSSAAGIGSNPNDKNNLTLFCQELKERMQAYRDDLILSIAVTISDAFYDFRKLNQCIDYFNVMTYDYAMGKQAHHDSPLYSSSYGASSMHRAVTFMKERVDTNKIIPGAAFYCRNGQFQNVEGLGNSLSTSMDSGSLSFKNLKELMIQNSGFVECYDEVACAAYAIYNGMFYSFDNEKSIIDKCNYVRENQLGGLMCWELTQDYVDENGVSVLVNAMYVTLKK